eukprot:16114046-Heterocapsa_arctica.AAC.1
MCLEQCKSVTTPAEVQSEVEDTNARLDPEEHGGHRRIVGKVMYAASMRPAGCVLRSQRTR